MVVHIQCSKLFKGMKYTVLPMVLCTFKKNLMSFEIKVEHSPGFGLRSVAILPKCAENDVNQYSLTPQTLDMEDLEPCTQQ